MAEAKKLAEKMPSDPTKTAKSKREKAKLIGGALCYKATLPNTCSSPYDLKCKVKICCKEYGCGKSMCKNHSTMATGNEDKPNEVRQYMCDDCSLGIQGR